MFRHFIGNVFLLDQIPTRENIQLSLPLPDDINLSTSELEHIDITQEQKTKIISEERTIKTIIGDDFNLIQTNKRSQVKSIITELQQHTSAWNGLNYINSQDPNDWEYILKRILYLMRYRKDDKEKIMDLIKICYNNWSRPLNAILEDLRDCDISIDEYFSLEKKLTFDIASFLSDFNIIQKRILDIDADIEPFIAKIRSAFLPSTVFNLEEFGLPRMIARKIQNSKLVDFEDVSDNNALKEVVVSRQLEEVKNEDGSYQGSPDAIVNMFGKVKPFNEKDKYSKGMFEDLEIDNDLNQIIKVIDEYNNGE